MLADAEDRHDVGVVELGDRLRLAAEPLEAPGVEVDVVEDLEGDVPPERLLDRLVDDPHPAPAQLAEDAELAQPLGDRPVGRSAVRGPGPRRPALQLLHQGDGRQQLADRLGVLGIAGLVLGDRGGLAPPAALGELLGQPVEQVAAGPGDGSLRVSSSSSGRASLIPPPPRRRGPPEPGRRRSLARSVIVRCRIGATGAGARVFSTGAKVGGRIVAPPPEIGSRRVEAP